MWWQYWHILPKACLIPHISRMHTPALAPHAQMFLHLVCVLMHLKNYHFLQHACSAACSHILRTCASTHMPIEHTQAMLRAHALMHWYMHTLTHMQFHVLYLTHSCVAGDSCGGYCPHRLLCPFMNSVLGPLVLTLTCVLFCFVSYLLYFLLMLYVHFSWLSIFTSLFQWCLVLFRLHFSSRQASVCRPCIV